MAVEKLKLRDYASKNGSREPDLFAQTTEGSIAFGNQYAVWIKEWLEKTDRQLPLDAKYLALGAGQARAELAMAGALGIKNQDIALLDMYFSDESLKRFVKEHRGVEIIPSDIFYFLSRPDDTKYSIISAFGIEGLLDQKNDAHEFISSLPRRMTPNGIACVCPYMGEDMDKEWKEQGFEKIRGHDALQSALLYVLRT